MTDNEIKLIDLIRDYKHPEKAMVTAMNIICWYLTQSQSSATPSVADSQELA